MIAQLLAPSTAVLLLLTLLTSPAPNSFVSVMTIFYGAVLVLLTYAWFTEVRLLESSSALHQALPLAPASSAAHPSSQLLAPMSDSLACAWDR